MSAQASLQSIQGNRAALLDIANQANRNFALLRARVDLMGRRSRQEHVAAIAIARDSRIADPRNAGMALIEAASLRSMGEFGDADDLLDEIDDYFLQLQVIHAMMRAQFDFVNNNPDRAKKTMAEIGPIAKEQAWFEPLLVRGWMAIADGDLSSAKRWAYEAKTIAPENVEVAVLIAWSLMEDSPRKSKDAISILRDVGIRSSPDDWFYLEALANAWARQSDWKQAKQQFDYALESAPIHMHSSLEQQLKSVENKRAPQIEWASRLRSHWKLET
jgi:tetratricopeptide (TPR) repeat protein